MWPRPSGAAIAVVQLRQREPMSKRTKPATCGGHAPAITLYPPHCRCIGNDRVGGGAGCRQGDLVRIDTDVRRQLERNRLVSDLRRGQRHSLLPAAAHGLQPNEWFHKRYRIAGVLHHQRLVRSDGI